MINNTPAPEQLQGRPQGAPLRRIAALLVDEPPEKMRRRQSWRADGASETFLRGGALTQGSRTSRQHLTSEACPGCRATPTCGATCRRGAGRDSWQTLRRHPARLAHHRATRCAAAWTRLTATLHSTIGVAAHPSAAGTMSIAPLDWEPAAPGAAVDVPGDIHWICRLRPRFCSIDAGWFWRRRWSCRSDAA